jgi:hypothetical protein
MRDGKSATLRSKNISKKGPLTRRSLGFARDDKGKGGASNKKRHPATKRARSASKQIVDGRRSYGKAQ